MNSSLFSHSLRLIYYRYWHKKDKFWLYEDIYEEWSFVGVEEGSFEYDIAGEKGVATFGDLVICPPQTPFRRIVISPLSFHHYKFHLLKDHGQTADASELPIGKISISNFERLKANYEMLKKIGSDMKIKGTYAACSHYLCDCLYLCCLELEEICSQPDSAPEDEIMMQALQMLRKQAFQPFSLESLAHELGMSQSNFTQRFKKIYKTTPSKYLSSLRLNKAKTLLLETDLPLDEIAECCGYQNGFYLNRVFTKSTGIPPGQYRKTHRI